MAKKQTVVLAWSFANIFLPQVDIVCDFCLLKSDDFFLLRYGLFCDVTTREFCRKVDKRRGSVKDAFLWKIPNANERSKYVHWHALKDGHLWLFEMLGVSFLKFQPILSKATCENCLHVVAGNNTYYYLSYASGQAWHSAWWHVLGYFGKCWVVPVPTICWRGRSIRCPSPTPELMVTWVWVATIESNHWEDSTA